MALRVVILVLAKTVVDEERRAAHQPVAQRVDEGLGLRVDFGQVVVRAFDVDRWAQLGWAVLPDEGAVRFDTDTALVPHAIHLAAVAR